MPNAKRHLHALRLTFDHRKTQIARHSAGKAIPDPILEEALARTEITDDPLQESVLTFADRARELGYLRRGRDALKELFATP